MMLCHQSPVDAVLYDSSARVPPFFECVVSITNGENHVKAAHQVNFQQKLIHEEQLSVT